MYRADNIKGNEPDGFISIIRVTVSSYLEERIT
jgi:hypothetical protein